MKITSWKWLIAFSLFLGVLLPKAHSSHLTGGEVTYTYLHSNYFIVKFVCYRECISSTQPQLDNNVSYRVFTGQNKNITYGTYTANLHTKKKVSPSAPNCQTPSGYCLEEGVYIDTIALGTDTVGYHVVWFRGNRNASVKNLFNPANIGSVWYCFIPPVKYKNSSPQFLTTPLPYLCAGKTSYFNQNVYDPDNDSLSFSNVVPYISPNAMSGVPTPTPPPFTTATYATGYSLTYPFGTANPAITIDAITGEITAAPGSSGQYVVSIQIKEYRYDPVTKQTIYLGEVRRDYQYFVNSCATSTNTPPEFNPDPAGYVKYVSPDSTICFDVSGFDKNNADTVYLWATGSILQGSPNAKSPFATFSGDTSWRFKYSGYTYTTAIDKFCWTPSCEQITYSSPYVVTFNLSDNGCNMVQQNYQIYVKTRPIFSPPTLKCVDVVAKNEIKLTLKGISAPSAGTFKQYKIYRRAEGSSTFVLVDSLTSYNATTWSDKTISDADTKYYTYLIKSENTCQLEGLGSDSISSLRLKYSITGNKSIKLTWNKFKYGTIKYQVWIDKGSGYVAVDTTTNLYYDIRDCNTTLKAKIIVNKSGCTSNSMPTNQITNKDISAPSNKNMLNATVLSHSSVLITFQPSDSSDIKQYNLYRSTNGVTFSLLTTIAHTTANPIKYADNTVSAGNNKYYYYLTAEDSCGNISTKNTYMATAELSATAFGHLGVSLSWKKFQGYSFDSVEVQRLNSGVWTKIAQIATSDSTYIDNNLVCNQKHYYRILSRSSSSTYYNISDSASATPVDTTSPTQVNIREVTKVNYSLNRISWFKSSSLDVKRYEIYVSVNGAAYSLLATQNLTTAGPYTYNHIGINNTSNTYSYQILGVDSCNNVKSKTTETHRAVKLSGTALQLSAKLDWNSYKGFSSVKNYIVQRLISGVWTDISTKTASDTTYSHTNLSCGINYYYRIKTLDNSSDNGISYSDSIMVSPLDTVSPERVNTLYASVINNNRIELKFKKVADLDVKVYQILVSINGGAYNLLSTVNSTGASDYTYKHNGVNAIANRYSYRVIAVDSCINNLSKTYEIHAPTHISGVAGNLSANLVWTKYKGFTTNYYTVQKWNGSAWLNVANTASGNDTSYSATGLECNIPVIFRVIAFENGGDNQSSVSDTVLVTPFDTIKPNKIALYKVSIATNNSVSLVWNKSKDNDVNQYIIYEKKQSSSIFTPIDTVYKDTFVTVNYTSGITEPICYKVAPVDSCGNNIGLPSDEHCIIYLTTSQGGCKQEIVLNWSKYIGFTSGIKEYRVYRSIDGGTYSLIKTIASTIDTFNNWGLDYTKTYTYRVDGIDNSGTPIISSSNTSTNQTFVPLTPTILKASKTISSPTVGEIVVKWEKQDKLPYKHIQANNLYFREEGVSAWIPLSLNTPVTTDSFIHTGLNTHNKNYEYFLVSIDSCGSKSDSSVIHRTTELKMTIGQLVHNLTWTPYLGFTVKKYGIETLQGGNWILVDSALGTATSKNRFPAPCNTAVYYRIYAESSLGYRAYSDTAGGQAIDTVPANMPKFKNATVLTSSKAQINFNAGDSADIYIYAIYRNANNGAFFNIANITHTTPNAPITYTDNITTTNDYHQYVVVTLDSCLNPTASDTFATIQLGGVAQNLQNRLFWKPFKGYEIDTYYIQLWNGSAWQNIGSRTKNDTFFVHTPINCNVKRIYQIKGVEKGGLRVTYSDSIALTPFDTTRPPAVTTNYATVVNGTSLYFSWQPAVPKVKQYEVELKSSNGAWQTVALLGNVLNYTFTGLNTLDSTYSVRVTAIDSCAGNRSINNKEHTVIQLKGTPLNLSNKLDWSAYSGFSGLSRYVIYRYQSGTWIALDSVTNTTLTYTHTNLPCNVPQYYKIRARTNSGGWVSFSDSVSLTPFDTTRPPAVVTNYATVLNGTSIYFEWKPAVAKVKQYEVELKSSNGAWQTIALLGNVLNYTYTGLNTLDSTYSVRVTAIDSCAGNKSINNKEHTVIQLKGTPLNLANKIDWSPYSGFSGLSRYVIYHYQSGTWVALDSVNNTTLTYTHNNLQCNVAHQYKVRARSSTGGWISFSDSVSVTPFDTITPNPVVANYASVLSGNRILVNWQKGQPKVKDYQIQVSSNGVNYRNIGITSNLTYTINGLSTLDSTYSVRVIAIDSCSGKRSNPSNIHTVIQLTGVAKNNGVELNWSSYKGFTANQRHIIYIWKNGWVKLDSVNGNILTYSKFNMPCTLTESFKIETKDNTGKYTTQSDSISLTPFDTLKPNPTSLKFVTVLTNKNTQINFNWDKKSDVKFFEIYRSTNMGAFTRIATVTYDSQYIDNTTNPQTNRYRYFVVAIDSCSATNKSIPSDTDATLFITAKTGGCKPLVDLTWTPYQSFSGGVSNYIVYRSKNGSPMSSLAVLSNTTLSFRDTAVLETDICSYWVSAIDNTNGYASFSDSETIIPEIWPRPKSIETKVASVQKTSFLAGENVIRWESRKTNDTFAVAYNIYHSNIQNGAFSLIKQETDVTKTEYIHTGVDNINKDNYYFVQAVNVCKVEQFPIDTHKHSRLFIQNGNLQTQLNWTKYKGFASIKNYQVLKSEDNKPYVSIVTLTANDTSFLDTNIRCNIIYSYKIKVEEQSGFSEISYSDTMAIIGKDTIPPTKGKMGSASVTSNDQFKGEVTLTFNSAKEANRAGYKIFRSELPGSGAFTEIKSVADTTQTNITYIDKNTNPSIKIYTYYIVTFDSCGNLGTPSDTHSIINLQATPFNGYNEVTWTNYVGWKNWTYLLERRIGTTGTWISLGTFTSTDNQFMDTKVSCNIIYDYRITGYENGTSNFAHSNIDSAKAFEMTPPDAPVLYRATNITTSKVAGINQIAWKKSNATDVANYVIQKSQDGINFTNAGLVLFSDSTYNDVNLNTFQNEYYYRVSSVDTCGNVGINSSDIHKTMVLGVIAGNQEMTINWTLYNGFNPVRYELYKNGNLLESFYPDMSGNFPTTWLDTMVICKQIYTYQIKAIGTDVENFSFSNRDSAEAYDTKAPRPVRLFTATVKNAKQNPSDPDKEFVHLHWNLSDNFDARNYVVYRKQLPFGIDEVIYQTTTPIDTTFNDTTITPNTEYCYRVMVLDYCNNASKSINLGCPMIVSGKSEKLTHTITWSPYREWKNGVKEYNIFRREDSSDWVLIGTVGGNTTSFEDNNLSNFVINHCYKIEAIEEAGGYDANSHSFIIGLTQPPIVWIPNAFTPTLTNGLNDEFGPMGTYFNKYDMKIYDRWGSLVYETSIGKPWDGKDRKGNVVAEGVYIYLITVHGFENTKIHQNGTIIIIK